MDTLITIVHIAACFLLIIAVLVQGAKSSAMGLFSGSGSDAVMGSASGPSFIKKFTITMALIVAVTSMSLTVLVTKQNSRSVVGKYADVQLPSSKKEEAAKPAPEQTKPEQTAKPAAKPEASKTSPAAKATAKPAANK